MWPFPSIVPHIRNKRKEYIYSINSYIGFYVFAYRDKTDKRTKVKRAVYFLMRWLSHRFPRPRTKGTKPILLYRPLMKSRRMWSVNISAGTRRKSLVDENNLWWILKCGGWRNNCEDHCKVALLSKVEREQGEQITLLFPRERWFFWHTTIYTGNIFRFFK